MKKIILMLTAIGLVGCGTTYETFVYVEQKGNELVLDTFKIDSRFAHDIKGLRKRMGLKSTYDGHYKLDKDSHLKINKKMGRYPKYKNK